MPTQFQAGATYSARSICDADCVFSFAILARTAKSVTISAREAQASLDGNKTVRRGITVYDGVEQFKPFGSHSMAAIVRADARSA